MKTYIYNNQKYTPITMKKLHIVFIGTLDECLVYAKKIDEDNNTDIAYVGSFGEYKLTSKKTLELKNAFVGNFDKDHCFVRYFG